MKKTLSLLAILLATAATSFAGEATKTVMTSDDCRFRANEWEVETSVVGSAGTYNGSNGQGIGGNLGINYFFTRYIGVGVDDSVGGYAVNGHGIYGNDRLQGDLLLRYPICAWNLAPYAMIGGGASWATASQGNGNLGIGAEYRFNRTVGLFADCRWLYGCNSGGARLSMALPRAGLSFAF